jgi:hypothetical protein
LQAALAVLALLARLAGLLAALLLLTRLLAAALLLAGLAWLIALLLLARFLVGILVLVLTHPVFLQRCWLSWLEDCLRDSSANDITPREFFRSVCNGMQELRGFRRVPFSM